ncbi:MAG: MBL fold metallo-hydrolase [Verrucomicrobia bacterium]|nr:MBL fold metallo-hydrolase [Verrucomicrobiota bacterium]
MSKLRVTFLGTGTSQGVPRVGCDCDVCVSTDPRDTRTRSSIYVETPDVSWVVDTGADFRSQCLRQKVRRVDAVFYTHAHTDHIMGFDDLRPFCRSGEIIPVYGSEATLSQLADVFAFAFRPAVRVPSYVHPEARTVIGDFSLGAVEITPLPLPHGRTISTGYLLRINGEPLFAYLTDCKTVPPEVERTISGVRHLVIDALRERAHPTHLSFGEALQVIERVAPQRAWLTHLCHEHRHAEIEAGLPEPVRVAFDGLVLEVN